MWVNLWVGYQNRSAQLLDINKLIIIPKVEPGITIFNI